MSYYLDCGDGIIEFCICLNSSNCDIKYMKFLCFNYTSLKVFSSVLAWRIPGTEEPSGLPSMGSHRVGHD